jgi:hypothetical protein
MGGHGSGPALAVIGWEASARKGIEPPYSGVATSQPSAHRTWSLSRRRISGSGTSRGGPTSLFLEEAVRLAVRGVEEIGVDHRHGVLLEVEEADFRAGELSTRSHDLRQLLVTRVGPQSAGKREMRGRLGSMRGGVYRG